MLVRAVAEAAGPGAGPAATAYSDAVPTLDQRPDGRVAHGRPTAGAR
jgi:hypothetical protein